MPETGLMAMAFPCQLPARGYPSQTCHRVTNPCVPDKLRRMVREISAGGVVLRKTAVGWQIAVIEPQTEASATSPSQDDRKRVQKVLLALPKGLVDPGEKPEQTAIREVMEETGLAATPVTKLGD